MGCSSSKSPTAASKPVVAKEATNKLKSGVVAESTQSTTATNSKELVLESEEQFENIKETELQDGKNVHCLTRHDTVEVDIGRSEGSHQASFDPVPATVHDGRPTRLEPMEEVSEPDDSFDSDSYHGNENGLVALSPSVNSMKEGNGMVRDSQDFQKVIKQVQQQMQGMAVDATTWLLPNESKESGRVNAIRRRSALFSTDATANQTKQSVMQPSGTRKKDVLVYDEVAHLVLPSTKGLPSMEETAIHLVFGKPDPAKRKKKVLNSPKERTLPVDSPELLSWEDISGYFAQLPTLWGDETNDAHGQRATNSPESPRPSLISIPAFPIFGGKPSNGVSEADKLDVDEVMNEYEDDDKEFSFRNAQGKGLNAEGLQTGSISTVAAT